MKGTELMTQLLESVLMAAGIALLFAAMVNFSDGALVHAVFWAVLGVGAFVVYLVFRVELVIDRLEQFDRELDPEEGPWDGVAAPERDCSSEAGPSPGRAPGPSLRRSSREPWGEVTWINRD